MLQCLEALASIENKIDTYILPIIVFKYTHIVMSFSRMSDVAFDIKDINNKPIIGCGLIDPKIIWSFSSNSDSRIKLTSNDCTSYGGYYILINELYSDLAGVSIEIDICKNKNQRCIESQSLDINLNVYDYSGIMYYDFGIKTELTNIINSTKDFYKNIAIFAVEHLIHAFDCFGRPTLYLPHLTSKLKLDPILLGVVDELNIHMVLQPIISSYIHYMK